MTCKGAIACGIAIALSACAPTPPPKDFFEGLSLATPDGDSVRPQSLRGRVVAFLFVDPLCPLVQDASQKGGMLQDVEAQLREDGAEFVLVGVSTKRESLGMGDFRAWQKDARLQGRMVLDTVGELARREHVTRLPWGVVLDAKGVRRYAGPAEAMDANEFVLANAVRRAMFGMDTPPGREEGEGCTLE